MANRQDPAAGQPEKKKRKIPWSMIYIGATILAVLLFGLLNREFGNVFQTMARLTPGFLSIAIVVSLVYFVFEGEIIRLLMRSQNIRMGFGKGLKISLLGIYYSYITPSATGGQPMQAAYLLRDKIPAGISTAVLIMKFFCFQCAFVACSLVSFLFMYPKLSVENPGIIPLIVVGLIINGASIIFFPSLFFKPVLHGICRFAKWLVGRFRFLQRRFHLLDSIDKFEADFGSYTDDFKEKKKSLVVGILLSVPQFILQMSVIYFIFLAFGYQDVSYWEVLAVQSLLQVSVSFMPMPGASGAQEIGFSSFFRNYFVNNDLYAAVMVWRFFTYYLVVIAGALLVVADQFLYRRKQQKEAQAKSSHAGGCIIRPLRAEEVPQLEEFLYHAIFVPEGETPPERSVINRPELQVYLQGFGSQKDDHALVAEVDGELVGAVWVRVMDDYGHVDDETPSFAISLKPEYRGAGIGTCLLQHMLELLREKGYEKASLAVQKANYAVGMYRKAGFVTVAENEEEYIMVNQLTC